MTVYDGKTGVQQVWTRSVGEVAFFVARGNDAHVANDGEHWRDGRLQCQHTHTHTHASIIVLKSCHDLNLVVNKERKSGTTTEETSNMNIAISY